MHEIRFRLELRPITPLGSLQRFPKSPSWRGPTSEGKRGGGEGRGGMEKEGRKREGEKEREEMDYPQILSRLGLRV